MPKKFQGENSKAAEARARKGKVAEDERLRKEKMAEDKLWEDNDKHILKKLERQEEKEKKQQEAMQKKLERDKLLEEEMNSIKGAKNAAPAKVTRAHIDATLERERLAKIGV
ncbi:hypothetical protein RvY_18999-2 [Ramazzottius varieornatus]|uniref:Uncharacterized protein n=1 Tax=Ramazzottius varieornatus TaxID=947166 RepID=A0A1D1W7U0_RAMVA|nr:hypothetical protein RvY_18999-2 [Ramazzottius varieornatus]